MEPRAGFEPAAHGFLSFKGYKAVALTAEPPGHQPDPICRFIKNPIDLISLFPPSSLSQTKNLHAFLWESR